MANISDVYNIQFECDTEETAIALEAYLKAIEATNPYYETTNDVTRSGLTMTGGAVMGRWTYANNLEGSFERPEQWHGDDYPKKEYETLLKLLKAGETINVDYSEDESGCEVFQDGYGQISWDGEKVVVALDFEEHNPPCSISEAEPKEEDEDNVDDLRFYCYNHDKYTDDEDRCEDGV